jgi:acyl carrier protein
MTAEDIKPEILNYLTENLFNGDAPADFNDETVLATSRLMDSIVALNMIVHFEDMLGIEVEAHEVNIDNLDTINAFASFLAFKKNNA